MFNVNIRGISTIPLRNSCYEINVDIHVWWTFSDNQFKNKTNTNEGKWSGFL